jgi:hypothetical protein
MEARETVSNEEWLEEHIPVEPGGTLFIDLDRGSVEVRSHDANEVHIQAEARGWASGMVSFSVSRNDNDVEFDGSVDGWFPNLLGQPRIRVRAWVPREYSVEIETRGGSIRVEEISGRLAALTRGGRVEAGRIAGPVLARTSGGRIDIFDVLGDLRARTSGGSIRLAGVKGDLEARTSGGSIKIEDAGGEVDARTSGGSITARFVEEPWGRLETSGGSISVEFRQGAGSDLDARASGGQVKIDHSIRSEGKHGRHSFRGTLNGGGAPLQLRTSGGSIRVRGS